MNIYLCSSTSKAEQMNRCAIDLRHMGFKAVSRWHTGELGEARLELNDPQIKQRAIDDAYDITTADILVSFSGPNGRGGRHWETGFAYGIAIPVWIVGPREHAFHSLASQQFDSWEELIDHIYRTKR